MDVVDIAVAGMACCFMAMAGIVEAQRRRRRRRRSVWVKSWIMDRPICGAYNKLITDLLNTDESSFRNFVRMDLPVFEELLSRVEFALTKKSNPPTSIHHCSRTALRCHAVFGNRNA